MSIELTQRCGVCRCYMDSEDLFCSNCGTENPHGGDGAPRLEHAPSHYSFDCKSCGASMSYDASARALRCPFCGGRDMERKEDSRSVSPIAVLPLTVSRETAEAALREWLGKGFWRPADAARASTIGEMSAVYVPYWLFQAKTSTQWTADSSPAPAGSRGDWYPVSGQIRSDYPNLLIGGSSVLTPAETSALLPFEMSKSIKPSEMDLENSIVEDFKVPRKLARPLARGTIESLEMDASRRRVPNRSRNVKVNVRIESMIGRPILVPVWILAYQYQAKVHRVLINGQTGKITGSAPFSYKKLSAVILIIIVVLLLISALVFLFNS